MKWKDHLIMFMIVVLVIAGITLISAPNIKKFLVSKNVMMFQINQFSANQLKINEQKKASFHFEAVETPSLLDVLKYGNQVKKSAVIGQIEIERLQVTLPILKGVNQPNLLAGAATMREDQQMGKGNYPLVGHHMKDEDILFGPLLKLKKQDKINITNKEQVFTYEVTDINTIDESRIDVIQETTDARLTLITCDLPTATTHRLMITAKLVKHSKVMNEEFKQEETKLQKQETLADNQILLLVFVLMLGFLTLSYFLYKRS
ncbi:class A sortase [Bacillus safensis]|uniref:class A sortase n=1 Tax=Bacillus safensis TaxID=561879 RepID=UPI001BA500EE|nr:class A sortase [Bacillus safensis]MBR0603814.1 class A sortase [Bacillus safensis]